jgi:two-component system repressor protein LuxO
MLHDMPVLKERAHPTEIAEDVSPLWKVERSAIEHAIALCEGNIPKAAALLEISPSTIYRKKMLWDKHAGNGQGGLFY